MNERYDAAEVFQRNRIALSGRETQANKGDYGKLLIVAGSKGMAGAAYLAGLAAYRTGIGMIKYFGPEDNRAILQTLLPEAMYESYQPMELLQDFSEDDSGASAESVQDKLLQNVTWADLVILGPGLSREPYAVTLVQETLSLIRQQERSGKSMATVIDADALNILSEKRGLFSLLSDGAVLTPHVGELARLLGKTPADVKSNLPEAAQELARKYWVWVVAKDYHTEIAGPKGAYFFSGGSAALAKAGSGDVLAGTIAGCLAVLRGMPEEAIPAAVCLHGYAGGKAAGRWGQNGTLARDIADSIPAVLKEI